MCGITGFVDFNDQLGDRDLHSMVKALHHRGPDGNGRRLFDAGLSTLGLGHNRLSIIDLSDNGAQPMSKGDWHISFNGEIYNYKEIRGELEALGHRFVSSGDTEVVLSSFEEWGHAAVHRLNGMFAFALYSAQEQKLYLYRDRAGVKPLYIYDNEELLLFASELKAFSAIESIKHKLNTRAVQEYFTHGYVPTPLCIYQFCYKLSQGSYLEVDLLTGARTTKKYWDVYNYVQDQPLNQDQKSLEFEIEQLIISSCKYRMVSDVPVGVFLSGGYDSSLVAALVQGLQTKPIKTFTIGFESGDYDESCYARQVAEHLGTEHHEYLCSDKEVSEIVPLLTDMFDEPFGDSSAIPTYLVSKMAKEHVTVALSADGGDEQFIGYNRYTKAIKLARFKKSCPRVLQKAIAKCFSLMGNNPIREKICQILLEPYSSSLPQIQTALLTTSELKRLMTFDLEEQVTGWRSKNHNMLNSLFAAEYVGYMQDDVMTKVDRAAMAVSLEGREPLLDYRIAEMTMSLPVEEKFKHGTLKYILKNITHKYIPKEIMDRPKHGFGIPINKWLRTIYKEAIGKFSTKEYLDQQGLFNEEYIAEKLDLFFDGRTNDSFVWHYFIFQMWYDKNMSSGS